jgi:hypothetical protein
MRVAVAIAAISCTIKRGSSVVSDQNNLGISMQGLHGNLRSLQEENVKLRAELQKLTPMLHSLKANDARPEQLSASLLPPLVDLSERGENFRLYNKRMEAPKIKVTNILNSRCLASSLSAILDDVIAFAACPRSQTSKLKAQQGVQIQWLHFFPYVDVESIRHLLDVIVCLQQIHIIGERHSGTNAMIATLKAWFGTKYGDKANIERSKLGFKHLWDYNLVTQVRIDNFKKRQDAQTLWIFAIREACHWIDGMYRKQWHRCDSKRGCTGGYVGSSDPQGTRLVSCCCFYFVCVSVVFTNFKLQTFYFSRFHSI